jgi:hypothetical protein
MADCDFSSIILKAPKQGVKRKMEHGLQKSKKKKKSKALKNSQGNWTAEEVSCFTKAIMPYTNLYIIHLL